MKPVVTLYALHFPIRLFELGNFVGFIPFGVFIPLLYRCNFIRFITLFVLSITILEVLQMLSRLGSFDIDDIIVNTLGAAIGFWAQRLVRRDRDKLKGIYRIMILAIVISIGTYTVVGGINLYLEDGGGEMVALHEVALEEGTVLWDESLSGFTTGQTKVEPQINSYSSKNPNSNVFSYALNGGYTSIKGYVAIPDNVVSTVNGRIEISFIADGTVIYSIGYEHLNIPGESNGIQPDSFQIPLQGVNELAIKIASEDANSITSLVFWDITLTEVNKGQKIMNSINEKIKSVF